MTNNNDWANNIAVSYLLKKGHTLLDRNYLKKYGEIDIVSKDETNKLHFVEVYERTSNTPYLLDTRKANRLAKVIQCYLLEKKYFELDFQVDIIVVTIDTNEHDVTVNVIKDIVL